MEENPGVQRPTVMTQPSQALAVDLPQRIVIEPDWHTIGRCRAGDREALRELFEPCGARVYSIVRATARRPVTAS
jgi:hypothetical protein